MSAYSLATFLTPLATEQLVVLVVTGLGFLALIVWAFTWGRRLKFPKGERVTEKVGALTVHVTAPQELDEQVVDSSISAVMASIRPALFC